MDFTKLFIIIFVLFIFIVIVPNFDDFEKGIKEKPTITHETTANKNSANKTTVNYPQKLFNGENISNYMKGNIIDYENVKDGNYCYELLESDNITEVDCTDCFECKVFVFGISDNNYNLQQILDVDYRIKNIEKGLYLYDVDFNGEKDILVLQGYFGNQAAPKFSCFLKCNSGYAHNSSFSDIMNASIDSKNKCILGINRGSAISHRYELYEFINNEFVLIEMLTEELDQSSESNNDDNDENDVWKYTDEISVNGEWKTKECFKSNDYTKKELDNKIYNENNIWGLSTDRWERLDKDGMMVYDILENK